MNATRTYPSNGALARAVRAMLVRQGSRYTCKVEQWRQHRDHCYEISEDPAPGISRKAMLCCHDCEALIIDNGPTSI